MPPKQTSTSNPSGNVTQTPASQTRPKKAPVSWEKDGTNGNSSIRIVLDWLAVEGNFQRWRGDTKGGLSKSALANEILDEMAKEGITHWDNKGIQKRIQDLQTSYGKARDYLRGTGAGLLDEDLENGTTTLQAALDKRFTQTNPDLLNGSAPNESRDSSTPRDSSPAPANPTSQTNKDTSNDTNNNDHDTSIATITPTVRGGGSKRKRYPKGPEPQGLEKVLSDTYQFQFDCFNAKERREDKQDKAREKREDKQDKRQARRERKQDKIQAKRERKQNKIEAKQARKDRKMERSRLKLAEVDAQIKLQNAETDEVGKRLLYVRQMKELGFAQDEINQFMTNQFSRGEGSRHKLIPDSSEDSSNKSTEDLSDESSSQSSSSSNDHGNTED
ncbi:hypothetical protein PCASD_06515 [Puccinia coronata f. sp. avenae]|uniref:Uncharacterized protein n=1 Tax=Puccinia coronata f. sp. avenae TaxID=200324 RepID=A0A2N5V1S9_9BASI|nr:hypothetical protein PCASD_06515 [Puccinia coronata f. sp. avenae]